MSTKSIPLTERKLPTPTNGHVIEFKGCTFNDGWEFGNPAILYSPVKRGGEGDVYSLIESVCIDLCCNLPVPVDFSACDLKEFEWRGWNPDRFHKRKSAVHQSFRVRFFEKDGELRFEVLEKKGA